MANTNGVGYTAVADDDISTYEVNVADLEDILEMEMSVGCAATRDNNGASASQGKPGSSIERLGKLMAMLGICKGYKSKSMTIPPGSRRACEPASQPLGVASCCFPPRSSLFRPGALLHFYFYIYFKTISIMLE